MIVAIIIIITKIILIIIMSIEKGNISTAVTHYGQQELGAAKWIEAPPTLCLNSKAFSFHKFQNIFVESAKYICSNCQTLWEYKRRDQSHSQPCPNSTTAN